MLLTLLKPLRNIVVVIKLDHFAHGILMDYNLQNVNKPILVRRYRSTSRQLLI